MKNLKKSLIILTFAAAILILFAVIFLLNSNSSVKIAFYKISPKVRNSVQKVILENSDFDVKFINLDKTKSLSEQKRKASKNSLLITAKTYDLESTFGKNANLQKSILSGMSSSVVQSVFLPENSENILYAPILSDFYQIDINYQAYQNAGSPKIQTWDDLLNFCRNAQTHSSLVFAGKDDVQFLDFFGCLFESLETYKTYENFLNELKIHFESTNNDYQEIREEKLTQFLQENSLENATLYKTLKEFQILLKNGIIKNSTFDYSEQDLLFQTDNTLCAAAFVPLSIHRKIARESVGKFTSIYFPAFDVHNARKFVTPQIVALPLKNNKNVLEILNLLTNQKQTKLSTESGLAPVQKTIPSPDRQSDDVRYWIAAANGILPPFSTIFPDENLMKITADFLKNKILLNQN